MINQEQEKIILRYLKDKNMAEDMKQEVLDHMFHQLEDEMGKGVSFEEAFQRVRWLWKEDLKPVWGHSFYKIPKIQKKKVMAEMKVIMIKSVKIALVMTLLLFLAMKTLGRETFEIGYEYCVWGMMVMVFVGLLSDVRAVFKMPLHKNLVSNDGLYHPIMIGLLSVIFSIQIKKVDNIGQILNDIHQGDVLELIMLFGMLFVQTFHTCYIVLASRKYYQDLKKLRTYKNQS